MNSPEIRQTFLDFFQSKEHAIVPSAPMVVKNDPTLMFTNAGMNQFKDIFLGDAPAFARRAADTQKCLRVSGKHNDLEEVGHDTYHHTMFEMLGNWSFGDYFKKEAIEWAWELLVEVYKMNPANMYATYFEGSAEDGIEKDQEALDLWSRFLPADHILPGNKKDNFWEMGETGPCGPCSEIHVDLRSEAEKAQVPGRALVNASHPQVIEIWNLVFMQFNRKASGILEPLPAQHVDTGMGFERLCMALQGKQSNYDTDVFQSTISKIGELCGRAYGKDEQQDIAMRVIADHLRAISFSIADGQLPANVKAGYVIRRILRRAVRYGYTFLGFTDPFLCRLVPTLVHQMGRAFPELQAQQDLIVKVIREEEAAFLRTLETGIRLLDSIVEKTKKAGNMEIDGKQVFELYDTFGFPFDLTELMAREKGLRVDEKGFEAALQEQKARSRNAAAVEAGDWVTVKDTDEVKFVGYDTLSCPAALVKYRTVKSKGKEQYQVVIDQTPFYGESGGQQGDCGRLSSIHETLTVLASIKENNLTILLVDKLPEYPQAEFQAEVDAEKRTATANNHTATHLLHLALREILGEHVEQKGSLVTSESLRFDFSHFQKVTASELRQVEARVNQLIRQNALLQEHRSMPIEQARQLGAMALFGEKYGDRVRVIQYGTSVELCGGTHVEATGQIGSCVILSESAISAGVRRIEATTGFSAEQHRTAQEDLLHAIKGLYNNTPNVLSAIEKTLQENAELKKRMDTLLLEKAQEIKTQWLSQATEREGVKLIIQQMQGEGTAELVKQVTFLMKAEKGEVVCVAGAREDGKPTLAIGLSELMVQRGLDAAKLIREAAKSIQGGGGGQASYATAGGKNESGIASAIEQVIERIFEKR